MAKWNYMHFTQTLFFRWLTNQARSMGAGDWPILLSVNTNPWLGRYYSGISVIRSSHSSFPEPFSVSLSNDHHNTIVLSLEHTAHKKFVSKILMNSWVWNHAGQGTVSMRAGQQPARERQIRPDENAKLWVLKSAVCQHKTKQSTQ